jgi:hypothetical protein
LAAGFGCALALIGLRAVDLAAGFRAGDFFNAAVFAAARDFGFCLAIEALPFRLSGKASIDRIL